MIELGLAEGEDEGFIALAERILSDEVLRSRPAELYVVHINNWFDWKWLKFSGKGLVPVWNRELTVPAFNPGRVVSQRHYTWDERESEYVSDGPGRPLHLRQTSAANICRFIARISPSAGYVWYSGNTSRNGEGSVMVYLSLPQGQSARHFSLQRKKGRWRVKRTTEEELLKPDRRRANPRV